MNKNLDLDSCQLCGRWAGLNGTTRWGHFGDFSTTKRH